MSDDYPQWSTLKPILDDPNVSNSDKQRLLNSYAQQAAYSTTNSDYSKNYDEIQNYADQYGSKDSFKQAEQLDETALFGPNVIDDTRSAGKQTFDNQLQRAQNDQQTGQANTDLTSEAGKTVAQGGSGAATSDDILQPGSRGMHYFEYFIPPYKDWTGNAPDLTNDIEKVYDNLRGINFAKFRADATQLTTSHGKLTDITMNLSTDTNSLGGFWQGPAAQAAQQYCGTFVQNAQTVTDGTTAASQVISDSMKAIETAVLQRAQAVLKMYATDIGGFDPDDIEKIIDTAKNKAGDDELRTMSKWNVFANVDWGDTNCNGDLSQNVKNLAAMDATQWLNQTFVPNFDQKKQAFDQITKSTHDTVGQAFDGMNQALGKINPNPFSDLSAGIKVPSGSSSGSGSGSGSGGSGSGSGSGSGGGGSTAPSSTGGGGTGGGGTGGGGTGGGGSVDTGAGANAGGGGSSGGGAGSGAGAGSGGGGTPSVPTPSMPTMPSGAGDSGGGATGGGDSGGGDTGAGATGGGTGAGGGAPAGGGTGSGATAPSGFTPPDSGGTGDPGTDPTTGLPTGTDPTTGLPTGTGTGTGTGMPGTGLPTGTGTPETLTVQHGNSTMTMTSPDQQGTMQLTTKDANGQTKTYDIDFGKGTATGTGLPTDTGTATPGATPGAAGAPADGAQHITPGPDGNAVIHDGNTTITAHEQPDGEVKVTVDDGSGQPTTYTLNPGSAGGATPLTPTETSSVPSATIPGSDPTSMSPGVATAPDAQPVDYTTQSSGFTDPSAMPTDASGLTSDSSGLTSDPSTMATDPSGFTSDPSSTMAGATASGGDYTTGADAYPAADPQSTTLSSVLTASADPGLGGAVGGSGTMDASGFAQGFSGHGLHDDGGGHGGLHDGGGDHGGLHDGGGGHGGFHDGGGGHGGGFHDAAAGAAGGGHAAADQFGGGRHHYEGHDTVGGSTPPGHAGLADRDATPLGAPGAAGLASAPPGALDQGGQGQPGGQGQQGGMPPMMGGGAGAGGGQGGDQQRGGNQWRTHGRLFDDAAGDETIGHFSGTLDDGR